MALNVKAAMTICLGFVAPMSWLLHGIEPTQATVRSPLRESGQTLAGVLLGEGGGGGGVVAAREEEEWSERFFGLFTTGEEWSECLLGRGGGRLGLLGLGLRLAPGPAARVEAGEPLHGLGVPAANVYGGVADVVHGAAQVLAGAVASGSRGIR